MKLFYAISLWGWCLLCHNTRARNMHAIVKKYLTGKSHGGHRNQRLGGFWGIKSKIGRSSWVRESWWNLGKGRAKTEKLLQAMQKQQRMKTGGSRRNGNYSWGERTNRKTNACWKTDNVWLKERKLYRAFLSFVGKKFPICMTLPKILCVLVGCQR